MNAKLSTSPCPSHADTHQKRYRWWMNLEPQWRAAFGSAFFQHPNQPTPEELESLWQTQVLRFAGPRGPYPNMGFELTDCSGLAGMSNLEVLVLTNHRLERISELASLLHLKSLFVNDNLLQSLHGIEKLSQLTQLYAPTNKLESIEPIRNLIRLQELYISFNPLKTLDGLTSNHAVAMQRFVCLPNEYLTDHIIMPLERKLGIRFRSL